MEISKAGSCKGGQPGCCKKGFTLIEVLVVLFLVSLIATVILPASFNLTGGKLERETRHIAAFISHLSTESTLKKKPIRLYYDLDNGRYWAVTVSDNKGFVEEKPFKTPLIKVIELPQGIDFYEVAFGRKMRTTNKGTAFTSFTPWGYKDKTWIYLKTEGGKITTIAIPALGEKVKIYDGYYKG